MSREPDFYIHIPSVKMEKLWLRPNISKAAAQNMLGEQLYMKIHALYPKVAGKMTGMILDGYSLKEGDALLDDPVKLAAVLKQAKEALEANGVLTE
jgi:hypothetical protein